MAPEDRQYKYNEYLRFGTSGGEDCFDFDSFFEKLAEFQGDESVRIFFSYMDLDKDGKICFEEYLYGRGEFEQNGNRYDFNEYEFVEKLMDEDLQKLQSERVGRIQQATFKYDEHGIIID